MSDSSALTALIQGLRRLPGVGVKSASRMASGHMTTMEQPDAVSSALVAWLAEPAR